MPPLFSSMGRKPSETPTQSSTLRSPSVDETLRAPGRPLEDNARAFMEPRFGHDFSQVRVHADSRARDSARALDARAYTVGRDIVFRDGPPLLQTLDDRRLLAHELTHVVQQNNSSTASSFETHAGDRFESEADVVAGEVTSGSAQPALITQHATTPFLGRDNKKETAAVLRQGTVAKTGLQFFPLQVKNTRIGPVSGEGGLADNTRTNLIVIVGPHMSLRRIAEILLPLWNSAAPFTPAGASTPLANTPVTTDVLARGLLVYNHHYLSALSQPAPSMTGWSGGLRLPLPVEIDSSGEAVVSTDLIRELASEFDAQLETLLDQAAAKVVTPAVADVAKAATDFLAATPDADDRGESLAVRSITNPVEALPLVTQTFNQLGTNRFDVALAFMDFAVNEEIALLASQRAGAGIIGVVRTALATPPAKLSAEQQEGLTRANLMLDLVKGAVARDPNPAKTCPVTAITPLTNADALTMEGGQTVIWNNTDAALQPAANELVRLIRADGGTAVFESAYRPAAYQTHLFEVWTKARKLIGNTSILCAGVRNEVNREMAHHRLAVTRPVGRTSNHTGGTAVDIAWRLPGATNPRARIKELAEQAGLRHPLPADDPPHFQLP